MGQKKVNVQMLEPQPTNGIRTIDTTSSQTIAKPNVGCCTSSQTAMQEFLRWYKDPNGLYFPSEIDDKINEFLEIEKQQIIDSFTAGQMDIAKCFFDEYKERGLEKTLDEFAMLNNDKEDGKQYFNNTFKK